MTMQFDHAILLNREEYFFILHSMSGTENSNRKCETKYFFDLASVMFFSALNQLNVSLLDYCWVYILFWCLYEKLIWHAILLEQDWHVKFGA
jgi:hypothetical protein